MLGATLQVPVELQDLCHLDLDSSAPAQAAFQRRRGLIYVQASYRFLDAVFEGLIERIYGRTFDLRALPAYQRSLAKQMTAKLEWRSGLEDM